MKWLKMNAMFWAGLGGMLLIYTGHTTEGAILLATLTSFAVGENNGERNERKKQTDS